MSRFNIQVPRFKDIDVNSSVPVIEQFKQKGIKKFGPQVQISRIGEADIKLFTPENIIEGIKKHSEKEDNLIKKKLYKMLLDKFVSDLGEAGEMSDSDRESIISDATTISDTDDSDVGDLEERLLMLRDPEEELEEEELAIEEGLI